MSFIKALLLAIVATLLLTYLLGASVLSLFDIEPQSYNHYIDSISALSFSALAALIVIFITAMVLFSVFSGLFILVCIVLASIATLAVGVFWPVILLCGIIYWLTKDNHSTACH